MEITIGGMSIHDYIEKQKKVGEVIENVTGKMTTNHYGGGRTTTLVCGGSVVISRKGRRFTLRGNRIEKRDGDWYVDGKLFDFNGEQMDLKQDIVKIEIHGNVEKLHSEMGDVTVKGDVGSIQTASGDVQCNEAVTISTMSGDVTCNGRPNSVSTMSGDIKY